MNIDQYIIKGFDFDEYIAKKDKKIKLEYTSKILYDVISSNKKEVISIKWVKDDINFISNNGVAHIEKEAAGQEEESISISLTTFNQLKKEPIDCKSYYFIFEHKWGVEDDETEIVSITVTQIDEEVALLKFWDDWYLDTDTLFELIKKDLGVTIEENSKGHSLLSAWTAQRKKK